MTDICQVHVLVIWSLRAQSTPLRSYQATLSGIKVKVIIDFQFVRYLSEV